MFEEILKFFILGFNFFGEAKLGILLAPSSEFNFVLVCLACLAGNLIVFPIFYKVIELSNILFLKNKLYKKFAIHLSLRARRKAGGAIRKHGVLGLMFFVGIPLPFTGAYIGTVAAYIFGIEYKKSLLAISTGLTISCVVLSSVMYFFGDSIYNMVYFNL